MIKRLAIGTRVIISEGSGIDSNKQGIIVSRDIVKYNSRGIPLLEGYYKPIDWSRESAVMLDTGRLITMFNNRLEGIQ